MKESYSTRRDFVKALGWLGCSVPFVSGLGLAAGAPRRKKPNFVILFTDDQGYQDLGCFGARDIKTPRLDKMAAEGTKFTSFYAQTVCGPSRTALMTGSYPMRADSTQGWNLHTEEITIAEILREAGYTTGCIGKWDLSGRKFIEDRHPLSQGFDYYFGTLGANDRGRVQLMRNKEVLGPEPDMGKLTGPYTNEAIAFIKKHADVPFFLYLAHTMAHVKLGASDAFRGKSQRGLYGDVIEEIDYNAGRVLDTLKELGISRNTIVLFVSDNGPWLSKGDQGGSALPLRAGKGSAWEGGFRVPCIMWGPGQIPAGRVTNEMMATLDMLPTFARLAGAKIPKDRVIDGLDQSDFVTGKTDKSTRSTFYYYVKNNLQAVRRDKWKLVLPREKPVYAYAPEGYPIQKPQLYDLDNDISERQDLAGKYPQVLEELLLLAERIRDELGDGERKGKGSRSFQS